MRWRRRSPTRKTKFSRSALNNKASPLRDKAMNQEVDVIVIGGGHAGYEAALASARMGCKTAMLCMDRQAIGRMSCNPSIGGIGKSHIVKEIDALGGEMARNADYTGIQFRTLNKRKGPAVQATRLQCDKEWFPRRIQAVIADTQNLTIIESTADNIITQNGRLRGISTSDGTKIACKAAVLATGTFLSGKIHIGKTNWPGGRIDEKAAYPLSQALKDAGHRMGRLKTGTPPRLHKDSIDYDKMEIQPGEDPPPFLSWAAKHDPTRMFHVEQKGISDFEFGNSDSDQTTPTRRGIQNPRSENANSSTFHVEQSADPLRPWPPGWGQMSCWLTKTNERTHEIINRHLGDSAMYGGMIDGTGVRYCPSIEDKIVKFAHHDSHHIFIEPEGRNLVEIYPNGTSNSLPEHVQHEFIRTIVGLERAVFLKPGYAIEYDYFDPTQLSASLESKIIEGLFFAGQINGTTGYEEAGGQGLVAGINAARRARGESTIHFSRTDSYLGVMIDDLITKGVDEPYRMFTSRAEYRLLLRQDNAGLRMQEPARSLGIVPREQLAFVDELRTTIDAEEARLRRTFSGGSSLWQQLKNPDVSYTSLCKNSRISAEAAEQLEVSAKYEGYIARELERIRQSDRLESTRIPEAIEYDQIKALRFEAREKLVKHRPDTLGQASRVRGVNPADVAILAVWIERMRGGGKGTRRG